MSENDEAYWREVDQEHREWREYAATLPDYPTYHFLVVRDASGNEQFRALEGPEHEDDLGNEAHLRKVLEGSEWTLTREDCSPEQRRSYLFGDEPYEPDDFDGYDPVEQ